MSSGFLTEAPLSEEPAGPTHVFQIEHPLARTACGGHHETTGVRELRAYDGKPRGTP
jgi:hypothetical protein